MDERLLTWEFPLPRTHTGALLGNGAQGLMVWGDEALNITVAHAGFWDHRGGNPFTSRTSYAEVLSRETGQAIGDPIRLIAPMLERFIATDRGFARSRKVVGGS